MKVKELMSKKLTTVSPNDKLDSFQICAPDNAQNYTPDSAQKHTSDIAQNYKHDSERKCRLEIA